MTRLDPATYPPAPEGWVMQTSTGHFGETAGPYYFRTDPQTSGVAFFSEPRHANMQGVVHGGALLTLADMSLFDICFRSIGKFRAVTVTLNSEFLGAGPVGAFIEASGELLRAGKTMLFCRGLITAKGAPVMSYSGTLKRVD
jgi:acyl-coenzyme A thioesterase PaaI-like protein